MPSKEGPNESLRAVRCVCSEYAGLSQIPFKAAGLIAVALVVGSAHLVAQQPYAYPAQQPPAYYYGQYAPPGQPYGAPQSQYGDPQYQQPQDQQPQYGQPQYAQPQPYAQQPPNQQAYPEQPASPQPAYAGDDQMQSGRVTSNRSRLSMPTTLNSSSPPSPSTLTHFWPRSSLRPPIRPRYRWPANGYCR